MLAALSEMTGLEKVFAGCALVGGVLFIFRLVMQFMGADIDTDGADGLDGVDGLDGADIDSDFDAEIGDTDYSFKLISLQGLAAFFMMFGLVGWAMLRQSHFTPTHSIFGGAAAGLGMVWAMKKIFEMAMKLQSSGTIKVQNALGQEGTVYLTIKPGDTGQIQVTVQNHLKIFNATSESEQEIKTGDRIRVVRIVSGNVLVVEKID